MIDEKKLIEDLQDWQLDLIPLMTYEDSDVFRILEEVVRKIEEQPTVRPQGIDKDRLIEEISNGYEQEVGKLKMISVDKAVKIINQQPTTDGWIPVSERLPSRSNEYWATIKIRGNYYVRKVDFNSFTKKWHGWVRNGDEVVAWQEEVIPQPYKESE